MSHKDVHNIPALNPPGKHSNFEDAYSLHPYLLTTASICIFLSATAVGVRTYVKACLLRKMGIEDYSFILSVLGFAAFIGVMIKAGEAGQGKHQWNVTIAGLQKILMLANVLEIIYPPTMFAAKFALLLQIENIFTKHKRNFHYWAVRALILLNLLVYTALLFAFIFACVPREKIWKPDLPGHCISTHDSIISTSAINIISDFSILILPIASISELHLPRRKKYGASVVFATGIFACIASIMRLYYSVRLTQTHDITWVIAPVGMWSLAEFATVIIVGCLPTFPRLWKNIRGENVKENTSYKSSEQKKSMLTGTRSGKQCEWPEERSGKELGPYISLDDWNLGKNASNELTAQAESSSQGRFPSTRIADIRKTTKIELH